MILPTNVNPAAEDFQARRSDMLGLLEEIDKLLEQVRDGGGEKAFERLRRQEKMPVRERVEGAEAFAGQVLERLANPFLVHRLADIALHHETKVGTRLLPTYREYKETRGGEPAPLAEILRPYL